MICECSNIQSLIFGPAYLIPATPAIFIPDITLVTLSLLACICSSNVIASVCDNPIFWILFSINIGLCSILSFSFIAIDNCFLISAFSSVFVIIKYFSIKSLIWYVTALYLSSNNLASCIFSIDALIDSSPYFKILSLPSL